MRPGQEVADYAVIYWLLLWFSSKPRGPGGRAARPLVEIHRLEDPEGDVPVGQ